jgi:hypothetical protein
VGGAGVHGAGSAGSGCSEPQRRAVVEGGCNCMILGLNRILHSMVAIEIYTVAEVEALPYV